MSLKLSTFGERMSELSGVRAIMKDIKETLSQDKNKEFVNLSAGNPLVLAEIESIYKNIAKNIIDSNQFGDIICRYGGSNGYPDLVKAISQDFNKRYNTKFSDQNVFITAGTQSLYFMMANIYGGLNKNGQNKKILLPMVPDYTGYGGISLYSEVIWAIKPKIEFANHLFKYHPNFDELKIDESVGAVLLSRPNNPSGNIISEEELLKISQLAKRLDIPVFVDSAYASPYPALNFKDMQPVFASNIINCFSFSKGGLAGERIGVAIGDAKYLEPLEYFQTNSSIHTSKFGQAIAAKAISSGKLEYLATQVIRPFYFEKLQILKQALFANLPDKLPWCLHETDGSMFVWLWFKDLPISDSSLYQKLKDNKLIVVPGNGFFPGLKQKWQHASECIRISLTGSEEELVKASLILAKVLTEVYGE